VDDTYRRAAGLPAPIAWMDGRVVPASEATVPLLDDGFLRGDAIFEGIMVRNGRTHALDAHLARLRRSAKAIGLRVPVVKRVVGDLLAAWGERDGAMKLVLTRGGAVRGLLEGTSWPASVALQPIDMPWTSALSGIKTLSYAVNMWAARQAREQNADDALIVSDGVVLELPTASICWVADGVVHSPDPTALPILESVTLRELQKVVDVKLGEFPLDDILAADEAFVVSATRIGLPVHAVGDVEFPAPGTVTIACRTAMMDHIDSTLDPLP